MIPEPPSLDQYTLTCLREADPVVQHYRAFFGLLDWSGIDRQDASRRKRGPRPHPKSAYIKAFLVGGCEGKPYRTQLRTFLVQHPWLVLELGFRPVTNGEVALTSPYGFDVEATVPTARWFREQLLRLDPAVLTDLLARTVQALQQEIPGLGETVAEYGDVVLAEYTQPFNEADVTYFRPLYQQAVVALKQFPTHVTADAAFDAWSRLRVRRPSRWHRRGSAQPA